MRSAKADLHFESVYLEAKAAGREPALEDELFCFAKLLRDNYDFKLFLEDPRVSADYKKKCIDEITPPGVSPDFIALLHALIDRGREELVEEISRSFTRWLSKDRNKLQRIAQMICFLC